MRPRQAENRAYRGVDLQSRLMFPRINAPTGHTIPRDDLPAPRRPGHRPRARPPLTPATRIGIVGRRSPSAMKPAMSLPETSPVNPRRSPGGCREGARGLQRKRALGGRNPSLTSLARRATPAIRGSGCGGWRSLGVCAEWPRGGSRGFGVGIAVFEALLTRGKVRAGRVVLMGARLVRCEKMPERTQFSRARVFCKALGYGMLWEFVAAFQGDVPARTNPIFGGTAGGGAS